MLIIILLSFGRIVSYCIRILSNSIFLMNLSYLDNGMNCLLLVWVVVFYFYSFGVLVFFGFGIWFVFFYC